MERLPHRFGDRTPIAAVRAAHEGLAAGESSGAALPAGRARARPPRPGQALVPRPRGPHAAALQLLASADGLGEEAFAAVRDVKLGDVVGVEGEAVASRRGELSLQLDGLHAAGPQPAAAARPAPRADRRRGALPPALPRPASPTPRAAPIFELRARIVSARPALPRRARLHRGRDAGAAAALRRRRRPARSRRTTTSSTATSTCASPPSCTSSGSSSAAWSASTRSARSSATRACPSSTTPSSRCSSLRGVRRLRGRHAHDRGAGRRRRAGGARHAPRSRCGGSASTSRRPGRACRSAQAIARAAPASTRWTARDDEARLRGAAGGRRRSTPARDDDLGGSSSTSMLSHYVEPHLVQPTFLIDYPVELSPLARRNAGRPVAASSASRRSAAAWRSPTASRSSTTPTTSCARFEEQAAARRAGDEEAHPVDDDYVDGAALRHAAHRWPRHRHRPGRDAADGPRLDPRGRPLPGPARPGVGTLRRARQPPRAPEEVAP